MHEPTKSLPWHDLYIPYKIRPDLHKVEGKIGKIVLDSFFDLDQRIELDNC